MEKRIEKLYSPKGCSLQGYMITTRAVIEETLGQELADDCRYDDGDKSYHEWDVTINNTPVTIYDYKECRSYLDTETITFHIGSTSLQGLFELMCIGFEPTSILSISDYRNKLLQRQS